MDGTCHSNVRSYLILSHVNSTCEWRLAFREPNAHLRKNIVSYIQLYVMYDIDAFFQFLFRESSRIKQDSSFCGPSYYRNSRYFSWGEQFRKSCNPQFASEMDFLNTLKRIGSSKYQSNHFSLRYFFISYQFIQHVAICSFFILTCITITFPGF